MRARKARELDASAKQVAQREVMNSLNCFLINKFLDRIASYLGQHKSLILKRVYFSADKFQDNKIASSIVQDLRSKGHNITEHAGLADVNGLLYFQEQVTAHGDSRRGGSQGSAQF